MKRFLFFFFAVAMLLPFTMHGESISVADARRVADNFFTSATHRLPSRDGQPDTRLAYTAQQGRFFVFDRGARGGFVIVSGDDRLPQVLGYGAEGDFTSTDLPPAVQYWMEFLDRQIAFLQSHGDVAVHHPAHRAQAVGPLLTSQWNQDAPYNNYCPTYGAGTRSMTGCVATATAQVMNYYQWPPVGRGSHSYICNISGQGPFELSADFSQSVYRWDLMLDTYDESSSEESCDAVARLMSDVGISANMQYGSSSGALENDASDALKQYFGYSDKCYWLNRVVYCADEWDQLLVDEIGKNRPVMYCGNSLTGSDSHAFVIDGYDNEGYYHLNWGWGGRYDGYFLVSLLNPGSYDFNYYQRGLFGLVPETQADAVDDVLSILGKLNPVFSCVPLGTQATFELDLCAQGNMLDTIGYEDWGDIRYYYDLIPVKLGIYDMDDVECYSQVVNVLYYLNYYISGDYQTFDVPQTLQDGEYKIKLFYSPDRGENFDHQMQPAYYGGKELYVKMSVRNDTAYFSDRFLSSFYAVDSFDLPGSVRVNDCFTVGVNVSYQVPWVPEYEVGPTGNVYLSLLKDGIEVAASPMCEVALPFNAVNNYQMQLQAPSLPGLYDLVLNDESGTHMVDYIDAFSAIIERNFVTVPIYVLPPCQELVEDFETMTANNSTSDKDVPGRFTTWSFNKSGVRAPGAGKCNGTNSVMMKKPSSVYTTQPVAHNFFLAQATFFNPSSTAAKYKLEYSLDGGSSWQLAQSIDSLDNVEVAGKSRMTAVWYLDLTTSQPATFRISMIGGGTAATYVDDIALYYIDPTGDVNGDGEVNIGDVNAIIDVIIGGATNGNADVNSDGEVNISDVNAVIDIITGI